MANTCELFYNTVFLPSRQTDCQHELLTTLLVVSLLLPQIHEDECHIIVNISEALSVEGCF